MNRMHNARSQSSMELLITVSFGLVILLPIVILALIQVSTSTSNLAVSEAQAAATKLAEVSVSVGSQGPPAKELVLIQIPQGVNSIIIGNGGIGHSITFVVNTNAGPSDAVAYTPVNVSGNMNGVTLQGTYLINVTAQGSCRSNAALPCVYISPS